MAFALRPAGVADAAAIAAVHVETWRAAYAHLLDAAVLAGLSIDDRAAWWADLLEAVPAGHAVDVAEADGRVVGFCYSGPTGDDDVAGHGEVYAVYVVPSAWGTGAGRALFEAGMRHLADAGHPGAVLWVLEGNARARAFYEGHGWVTDGATKPYDAGATAVRYRHPLR